ncbi:MAG: hypothetical protein RL095_3735 [Verrucomicrobiota bacterium]
MNPIDFILHVDQHLIEFVRDYGLWIYALLFLIIFCETGLVFLPLLPGDSLLLAAGGLCALSDNEMNLLIMIPLLCVAAIAGDFLNFTVGHKFGEWMLRKNWVKQKHVEATHSFFEEHGGKAVIYARFAPFMRTFVPFVAGMGDMSFKRFAFFNIVGGILWVVSLSVLGYFCFNIPFVKNNTEKVILLVIFVSMIPPVLTWWKHRRKMAEAEAGKSAD